MRSMAMATTMRMIMTMMLKRWMRTMMIMILIKRRDYYYAWSSSLPSSRSMTLLSTIQQQNTFDQDICKSLSISLLKIITHLHISLDNVVNDGKTPKLFRQEAPISEFCWKPAKMIILLKGTAYPSKVIVGRSDHSKHERAINYYSNRSQDQTEEAHYQLRRCLWRRVRTPQRRRRRRRRLRTR